MKFKKKEINYVMKQKMLIEKSVNQKKLKVQNQKHVKLNYHNLIKIYKIKKKKIKN